MQLLMWMEITAATWTTNLVMSMSMRNSDGKVLNSIVLVGSSMTLGEVPVSALLGMYHFQDPTHKAGP
jgi:hypothetical protein